MGLGKIAIGLIATGVGVVAVGSIVGGVVASRSAETQVSESNGESTTNNGNNKNPNEGVETDKENTLDNAALSEVLNKVSVNNIRLTPISPSSISTVAPNRKSLSQTQADSGLKIENVFAFNISKYTFGLSDVSIPENVTIEVSVKAESLTNLNGLNDGKLTLVLKAKSGINETTRELNVETFKKPSEALKGLVKTENDIQYTLEVLSNLQT